jgi:hypothetical protein
VWIREPIPNVFWWGSGQPQEDPARHAVVHDAMDRLAAAAPRGHGGDRRHRSPHLRAGGRQATSTKGCPKEKVDAIETVDVVKDPLPAAKGVYLSVCDAACASSELTGPLASTPSATQLENLKGKPLCLSTN